ncbi:hypothetical protein TNCV_2236101 [Trichonephila clavipes]|nr:hypothetical protein TNCV_2236101 [Trichonephila clavipes]
MTDMHLIPRFTEGNVRAAKYHERYLHKDKPGHWMFVAVLFEDSTSVMGTLSVSQVESPYERRIQRVPKSGRQHDHQVTNFVTKEDANLALLWLLALGFRQVPIESSL